SEDDPVVPIVRELLATHPQVDAELVICSESLGANAKVSKLAQIARRARNEILVVSDADTRVTPDFLTNVVLPLKDPDAGLVNCFYRLANPVTVAMRWEALAVNADFWTHVLQSRHLKPIDFALGAVMAMRREELATIGGFEAIVDYLADDYQLGNRIARAGKTIALCPVTVECRSAPHGWHHVWSHQLRWARTIRVCQPWPYFLSVLGNASFWPLLWVAVAPTQLSLGVSAICLLARVVTAQINEARLTGKLDHLAWGWLIPVKDLLQFGIWAASFTGSRVEWRGVRYQVLIGGKLVRES
ncbi:MAG TPA: glycosyltransferase, partial [Verrucomicrobiae bacterium]|nr:glycosyltransferase [Verrucomicrobiae bacterium]